MVAPVGKEARLLLIKVYGALNPPDTLLMLMLPEPEQVVGLLAEMVAEMGVTNVPLTAMFTDVAPVDERTTLPEGVPVAVLASRTYTVVLATVPLVSVSVRLLP